MFHSLEGMNKLRKAQGIRLLRAVAWEMLTGVIRTSLIWKMMERVLALESLGLMHLAYFYGRCETLAALPPLCGCSDVTCGKSPCICSCRARQLGQCYSHAVI